MLKKIARMMGYSLQKIRRSDDEEDVLHMALKSPSQASPWIVAQTMAPFSNAAECRVWWADMVF